MAQVVKTKTAKQLLSKPKLKNVPKPDIKFELPVDAELKGTLEKEAKKSLARKSFYDYCRLVDPLPYAEDAEYLKIYCNTLQAFKEGRIYSRNVHAVNNYADVKWDIALNKKDIPDGAYICTDIMINMPPQHFKTRTLTHFSCWMLGTNNKEHIGCVSYAQDVADDMSRYTRNEIAEQRQTKDGFIFADIFPTTRLNPKDKSVTRWALENSHFSYLASGIEGQVTSKGFTVKIVDDPIKGDASAMNETLCDGIYTWYTTTFASRKDALGGKAKNILNMTRWSIFDLAQRIMDSPSGKYYYMLQFKAYDEDKDKMLCERFLSKDEYVRLHSNCVNDVQLSVFLANYQQETINLTGALYGSQIKTYAENELPRDKTGRLLSNGRKAYVDVADKGKDYLCAGAYNEYGGMAYMIDVLYTLEPQSKTEMQMADFIIRNQLTEITFESNNGGGEFGRHVEEQCHKKGYYKCRFRYIWNRSHKHTRIMTQSGNVISRVRMPNDWRIKFPEFSKDVVRFQKNEKDNKNDDCADMLTGLVSTLGFGGGSVRAKVI